MRVTELTPPVWPAPREVLLFNGSIEQSLGSRPGFYIVSTKSGRRRLEMGLMETLLSLFLVDHPSVCAAPGSLQCSPGFAGFLCYYSPPCSTHRPLIHAQIQSYFGTPAKCCSLSCISSHLAFPGTYFTDLQRGQGYRQRPPLGIGRNELTCPPALSPSACSSLQQRPTTVSTGKPFLP